MKLLLDTNVIIAALISRGVCQELLEYCVFNHELFISEFILAEIKENLTGKFRYSSELANEVDVLLRSRFTLISPAELEAPVCRDADDDNILAAARESKCLYIITGDKDLLELKQFGSSFIVTPRQFLVLKNLFE